MRFRQLKVFMSVYETRSFTQAAKQLFVVQPSISQTIKDLERKLNCTLFIRNKHQIEPTEAARILYGYASRIDQLMDQCNLELNHSSSTIAIRLGVSISIADTLLAPLLHYVSSQYPDLQFQVEVENAKYIEKDLKDGTIDVGMMDVVSNDESLKQDRFASDRFVFISSKNHPLAHAKQVTLETLAKYPLLLREKGSASRELVDHLFGIAQLVPTIAWQSRSSLALIRGVQNNIGIAFLPLRLVESMGDDQLVILSTKMKPLERQYSLVYYPHLINTQLFKQFIDCVIQFHSQH